MSPHVCVIYRNSDGQPSVIGAWPTYCPIEYHRLTNARWNDVIAKDINTRIKPGSSPSGAGSETQCEWTLVEKSPGIQSSAATVNISSSGFYECWSEPHSKFYTESGQLMTKKPEDKEELRYAMTPHLTLLFDKQTRKLAGGYWWGEFHNVVN